jgi:hypothetical protein
MFPFGGPALGLFGLALCFCHGCGGEGWCSVVFVEPAAARGGDVPQDGGAAASPGRAAGSLDVAGLLVPVENLVVGGQKSPALAWFGQEAGQGGG